MNKFGSKCLAHFFAAIVAFFILFNDDIPVLADEPDYLAPETLLASRNGKLLYVAEKTARQIAVFDVAQNKMVRVYQLAQQPSGMALDMAGHTLFVAIGGAEGQVIQLDLKSGKTMGAIPVGHTPIAPVLSPDGKTLYVCNRFNHNVSVLDTASCSEVTKIAVEREPCATAITTDGNTLFVANFLPNSAANKEFVAASISAIDVKTRQAQAISLANGSSSVRGICISPDNHFLYVVHTVGHFQQPTIKVERGWMNTSVLSVIDVVTKKVVNTVLLDEEEQGAANPWSVACTNDGASIIVTHAGTHEISVINRAALHAKLDQTAQKGMAAIEYVPNDFSFLTGIRLRIKLRGIGPRGVVIIGHKAIVAEYFSDTLGIVNLASRTPEASIPLGPQKPMSIVRKGEMLFNDAMICRQQWQSCASCHPDGREDGLNWDLLNDGMGNPKNAKSMLYAHRTPPSMWLGVRASAEKAVRAGIRYIEFSERPESDAIAIDEYLKSLEPEPSPFLVNGKLSESAQRGKKVFEQAQCTECHLPPLYAGSALHDLGLGTGKDQGKPFTVPTLIEVWRTAPYLHDGRALTIKEVITEYSKSDLHGSTPRLSPQEIEDLVDFIKSL